MGHTGGVSQEESISTLKFAARCMRVNLKPRVNEVVSDGLLLRRANRHISLLQQRVRDLEFASASSHPTSKGDMPPRTSRVSHAAIQTTSTTIDQSESEGQTEVVESDQSKETMRVIRYEARPSTKRCGTHGFSHSQRFQRGKNRPSVKVDATRTKASCPGTTGAHSTRSIAIPTHFHGSGEDLEGRQPLAPSRRTRNVDAEPRRGRRASGDEMQRDVSHLRARQHHGNLSAGKSTEDQTHLATRALLERFSCREAELLQELETWKSLCRNLREGCAEDDDGHPATWSKAGAIEDSHGDRHIFSDSLASLDLSSLKKCRRPLDTTTAPKRSSKAGYCIAGPETVYGKGRKLSGRDEQPRADGQKGAMDDETEEKRNTKSGSCSSGGIALTSHESTREIDVHFHRGEDGSKVCHPPS